MLTLDEVVSENETLETISRNCSRMRHPSTDIATGSALLVETVALLEGLQIAADKRGNVARGDILETARLAIGHGEWSTASQALARLVR